VDACLRVDADEFESSTLEHSLSQLFGDTQRCDKRSAIVAGCERFEALSDAADDIVSRRLDFNRDPLAFRRQCDAVDYRVAGAGGLHRDLVTERAVVPPYCPLEPLFICQNQTPAAALSPDSEAYGDGMLLSIPAHTLGLVETLEWGDSE